MEKLSNICWLDLFGFIDKIVSDQKNMEEEQLLTKELQPLPF